MLALARVLHSGPSSWESMSSTVLGSWAVWALGRSDSSFSVVVLRPSGWRACTLQLKESSKYPFSFGAQIYNLCRPLLLDVGAPLWELAMWAQHDLTTRRLWFPDVNALLAASTKHMFARSSSTT